MKLLLGKVMLAGLLALSITGTAQASQLKLCDSKHEPSRLGSRASATFYYGKDNFIILSNRVARSKKYARIVIRVIKGRYKGERVTIRTYKKCEVEKL